MDHIYLLSGMKNSLLSMNQTDSKLRRTLERLASGMKVNSPLDNATNFFIAHSLRNSAADIDQLHDAIGESVNVIRATGKGLESITSLLQSMKSMVDGAATSSDIGTREALARSFDETYAQINYLVKDSGYAGSNLISNHSPDPLSVVSGDLNIAMNPRGSAELQVTGSFMGSGYVLHETPGGQPAWVAADRGEFITGYGTTTGGSVGNLSDVTLIIRMNPQFNSLGDLNGNGVLQAGEGTEIDFKLTNTGTATASAISFSNAAISTGWSFAFNTEASFGDVAPGSSIITDTGSDLDLNLPAGTDGVQFSISLDVTSDGVTKPFTFGPITVGGIANGQTLAANGTAAIPAKPTVNTATLKVDSADYKNRIFDVTFPGPPVEHKTLYAEKQGLQIYHSWVYYGFLSEAGINAAKADLDNAISKVRSYAAQIGNSSMIVAVRNEFNDSISNTFLTGADNLTLADMNEESVNALMLQTRHQLGATSLSIGSEAFKGVMKMLE